MVFLQLLQYWVTVVGNKLRKQTCLQLARGRFKDLKAATKRQTLALQYYVHKARSYLFNHMLSYDFVHIRDVYGGRVHLPTITDEFSRQC